MLGYSLLKDLYDAEWQRRDQLGAALGIPLAVLTVVASVIAFAVQRADFRRPYVGLLALLLAGVAGFCFARAVRLLVRSFHGHLYRGIPYPAEITKYEDELYRRHRAAGNADTFAEVDFHELLRDRYGDAADRNARINALRGELLFQANGWMLWAFAIAILAGLTTVIDIRLQPDAVYQVHLNGGTTTMSDDKSPSPPTPAPAPTPIEKPVAPVNHDLRTETKVPTKK